MRSPAQNPPLQNVYRTKLDCVGKLLIINEILVEATGVELSSVLTARKLLIPGSDTTARKASLPDPLYVYCTKKVDGLESSGHVATLVSHGFARVDRGKSAKLPELQ